jgi:beta-lactamase class A
MIKQWFRDMLDWMKRHHRLIVIVGISLVGLLVIVQFIYPQDHMLPYSSVDGRNFSGWSKTDVIKSLNGQYQQVPIDIYFGSSAAPYISPTAADIGLSIDNTQRINAVSYPWYARIIPGSLFFGTRLHNALQPVTYSRDAVAMNAYVSDKLGKNCDIIPKNASATIKDGKLVVVPGIDGGTCSLDNLSKSLGATEPNLAGPAKISIPVKVTPADVRNADAQKLIDAISSKINGGLSIKVGSDIAVIPGDVVAGWLDFSVINKGLIYTINPDRAGAYLNSKFAASVAVAAGVTTVSTYDFVETSRQTGPSGLGLSVADTTASIKSFIDGIKADIPVVLTAPVAPTIKYNRSYSPTDTGLAALMKNFADTHSGSFGISMTELSGQYRHAAYSDGKSFTTASTYKLFVAYSTLRRIESGEWHWSDQVQGGRDLTKCFDDMIVVSDNDCASALLQKIGFTTITNEAHDIGCVNTSFLGSDGIKSTPADLALLLAQLQTGQILGQQSSRDTLINAMKRNIYRQGIPAGASGVVADKVGFLDALLHDGAIVYGPAGTHVLVIMSDGSSWSDIADLTRQIEALRTQ